MYYVLHGPGRISTEKIFLLKRKKIALSMTNPSTQQQYFTEMLFTKI